MSDHEDPARDGGVSRRNFVTTGLMSGAFVLAGRRITVAAPESTARRAARSYRPPAFELEEITIAELQEGMRSGKYTSRRITEMYLERIAAMDRAGPRLNQVLETNPDALAIADAMDAERRAKGPRGQLHGIPILVKDNIATADKMTTTAGSLALAGSIAPRDSWVAARLRAAGAVLLGKTNLSEWANFRSSHSTSGWCGRAGQGFNPYALDRTPSGSSSGSGAATAANFCAAAIGTETDGSIVSPSSANSLVGIKPTVGLVSRTGVVPISQSQDSAGPMARCVADAAAMLGALTGVDPTDSYTEASRGRSHTDYTKFLDPNGLKGARIGVIRERFMGRNTHADAAMEEAIALMRERGATIVDPANVPTIGKFRDSELEVLLYEFKADLAKYFAWLGPNAPVKTLADVIAFNDAHKQQEMPYFGQETMLRAEKKGPLTSPEYLKAVQQNHQLARVEGIDATLAKYKLDALVAPTQGPPWFIDLVNGDSGSGGGSSSLAAVAGCASITVPAGYAHGLPVGISFIGSAFSEPVLIRLAYAYEQASKHRRPPTFAATAPIPDAGRAPGR